MKVFNPFQSTLKQTQEMMEIDYSFVFKRRNKPYIKGSRIEPIEKLERIQTTIRRWV